MSQKPPLIWIATEDLAGTRNQCLGVAEALGTLPVIKTISLREPWKSLSPYLGCEGSYSFVNSDLIPPWPDILIASGRKSIAAARYIKKQSGGKTFTVQIQDPRIHPKNFDLVAVPSHDPTRGENVIVTTAAPNRITAEKLLTARDGFSNILSSLPAPRIAVLIGGNSKVHRMTPAITEKICDQLLALVQSGYSLMITASRRTGEENAHILKSKLNHQNIFFWDGLGENPYFGFLAWADAILVTSDSTSMISESATTGKPVYILPLEGGSKRHDKMLETFHINGITRSFTGVVETWHYQPLKDAEMIADEIRRKTGLF
jgi:uncharacterized protein